MFHLGILAILLHDTGYLKRRGDDEGTGAKYTEIHVQRSADFAALLLTDKGFSTREIQAVQSMILCTGIRHRPSDLPFASAEERVAGLALGTSDLLGQMSADDYIEKLPVLFQEFAEAARHSTPGNTTFHYRDAEDLMERTPSFWHNFVLPKLERDFDGIYRYLNDPYPEGPNPYLESIESNLWKLDHLLANPDKLGYKA
jgi:hypothetical protein